MACSRAHAGRPERMELVCGQQGWGKVAGSLTLTWVRLGLSSSAQGGPPSGSSQGTGEGVAEWKNSSFQNGSHPGLSAVMLAGIGRGPEGGKLFLAWRCPDVLTVTDWQAPVVWEGTFSRLALEGFYRRQNITVGLAVFAPDRSAATHLERFLQSATKHFMPGHRVVFYLIMDGYCQPPHVEPSPLTFQALMMGEERWWLHPDLRRLQVLARHLVQHIGSEVDFLFSMAGNLIFQSDFGPETLGPSVAQLHAWCYFRPPRHAKDFPYERQPSSAAYIPFGQGDFYYGAAIVGGTPSWVLGLVETCLKGLAHDVQKGLNSTFERHLNKYFFLHKPSKLLSPEYGWDPTYSVPSQVRNVKVAQSPERSR
ncbi:LOW QUALITY PROTEIN: putative glycosyltransferase 6 domain-containing protein 1 [Ctenodactylus gundi]